jgi:two-component sensor histidine kinase
MGTPGSLTMNERRSSRTPLHPITMTARADAPEGSSALWHRVNIARARLISFVTRSAAFSSVPQAAEIIDKAIDQLHATSKVRHALRPPVPGEMVDLTAQVAALCEAFRSADLKQRGVDLHLAVAGQAIVEAVRSWRASLIIAELMTNSVRHACSERGTWILVAVVANGVDVVCQISNDGRSVAAGEPSVGSRLIEALAEDLKARIIRSCTTSGAVATLCFPMKPESF